MHVPELLARHALLEVQRALSDLLRDAVADLDVVRLVAADESPRDCNRTNGYSNKLRECPSTGPN